ncbi:sensor histidine kinase [Oryzihumus sp.]|uniref:sensor histidine kinase n=1 Tax=Oryzihumus sp. TaxID=1968903 RepID=UPI002EDA7AD7
MTPALEGLAHNALIHASDDELLAAAVPFLREGLTSGGAAVAVCNEHQCGLLSDALGDNRLQLLPGGGQYRRSTMALDGYRRMMEDALEEGVSRVWLVSDTDFGQNPLLWQEWARYEAYVNRALAAFPLTTLCLYDARRLPEQALRYGRMTHPRVRSGTAWEPNHDYLDPDAFNRAMPPADEQIEATPSMRAVLHDRMALSQLREDFRRAMRLVGTDPEASEEFIAAFSEVAANALVHGLPPVWVRLWAEPQRLACTVSDHGSGFADDFAGYLPEDPYGLAASGRGLWLARMLCDRVEMWSDPAGFTVRLSTWPD